MASHSLIVWQQDVLALAVGIDVFGQQTPTSDAKLVRVPAADVSAVIKSPTELSTSPGAVIDGLLFPVLTLPAASRHGASPLSFLLASLARIDRLAADIPAILELRMQQAGIARGAQSSALAPILAALRASVVSYTVLSLTEPDMFPGDSAAAPMISSAPTAGVTRGHLELISLLLAAAQPTALAGNKAALPSVSTLVASLVAHCKAHEDPSLLSSVFEPLLWEASARLLPRYVPSDNPTDDDGGEDDEELVDAPSPALRHQLRVREAQAEATAAIAGGTSISGYGGAPPLRYAMSLREPWEKATPPPPASALPSFPGVTLLKPASFEPLLGLIDAICEHGEVVKLLLSVPKREEEATTAQETTAASAAAAFPFGGALTPTANDRSTSSGGGGGCALCPTLWGVVPVSSSSPSSAVPPASPSSQSPAHDGGVAAAAGGGGGAASPSTGPPRPPRATPSGRDLERKTFLGRLFSLGPQRPDFISPGFEAPSEVDPAGAGDLLRTYGDLPNKRAGAGAEGDDGPDGEDADTFGGPPAGGVWAQQLQRQPQQSAGAAAAGGGPPPGAARLLPRPLSAVEAETARTAFRSQWEGLALRLRAGMGTHAGYTRRIVDKILKKGGREAVFGWFGALLDANEPRCTMMYTAVRGGPTLGGLSSGACIANATRVLLSMCEPFMDPADPKTARIDLRFASSTVANGQGGGRFHDRKSEHLATFVGYAPQAADATPAAAAEAAAEAAEGGSSSSSSAPSWIDPRNLARQQQFAARQSALLRDAESSNSGGAAAHQGNNNHSSLSKAAAAAAASATSPASSTLPPRVQTVESQQLHSSSNSSVTTDTTGGDASSLLPLREPPGKSSVLSWHPICEMYWLASRAVVVGHSSSVTRSRKLAESIKDMKKARGAIAREMRGLPGAGVGDPNKLLQKWFGYRANAKRIDRFVESFHLDDVWMNDPLLMEGLMKLHRLTAVTMTRAVCGNGSARLVGGAVEDWEHVMGGPNASAATAAAAAAAGGALPKALPSPHPSLPLPPPSAVVCGLPEYVLTAPAEHLLWLSRYHPRETWLNTPTAAVHDFLTFFLVFMASPLHVHNPYLRGKLVEALTMFVPHPQDPFRRLDGAMRAPALYKVIGEHGLASTEMLPALTVFYVDIAFSGSHTVFYDKFHYRSMVANMIDYCWQLAPFRASLVKYGNTMEPPPLPASSSSSDGEGVVSTMETQQLQPQQRFLNFASAVASDVNHHMEEAIKCISTMREVERLQEDSAAWAALSEEVKADKLSLLKSSEGQAKSWLFYSSEQVHLMALLSSEISSVWLCESLRDRVVSALGLFLDTLISPSKRRALRVKNMDALGFKPRDLLLEMASIYNNLTAASEGPPGTRIPPEEDTFALSIVRDERSFHVENFVGAAEQLVAPSFLKDHPSASNEAHRLGRLVARVRAAAAVASSADDALGEIPSELCDPLVFSLITDPVLLPTSAMVMDRSSIQRCLMESDQDPFNRKYLNAGMLTPLPRVKEAIGGWVAARRRGDAAGADALLRSIAKMMEEATTAAEKLSSAAVPAAPVAGSPAPLLLGSASTAASTAGAGESPSAAAVAGEAADSRPSAVPGDGAAVAAAGAPAIVSEAVQQVALRNARETQRDPRDDDDDDEALAAALSMSLHN